MKGGYCILPQSGPVVRSKRGRTFRLHLFMSYCKRIAALKRRQLVLVLLLVFSNEHLLQETLGQISPTQTKRDCQSEHQGSEDDSEGDQHGLLSQSQFFKNDRQDENN